MEPSHHSLIFWFWCKPHNLFNEYQSDFQNEKFSGARSATAAVIVDESGERFIVSEDDHAMPMTADSLPLDEIVDAGAVLSDLSWIEGTRAAFEVARAHHVPTLVDLDIGSGRLLTDVAHLSSRASPAA